MVYSPSKKSLRTTRLAVDRLVKRWKPLRPHPVQSRLWHSKKRIRVVYAGRRSGKSEVAKRHGVLTAFSNTRTFDDYPYWVLFAGPTGPQMHNLYWEELTGNLIPQEFITDVDATHKTITLWNGVQISVVSLDKPVRAEGRPIDALYVDEFSEVKERAWTVSLRPALSTDDRFGTAWLYGVPRGGRGGHFHQMAVEARRPANFDMEAFHWTSRSVLEQTERGRKEIEAAQRSLAPRIFAQEYEADFTSFAGRAYYTFNHTIHAREALEYRGDSPLIFCFDFNRNPGVAVVAQEQTYRGNIEGVADSITAVIGEVWIPQDSNTRRVCEVLAAEYGRAGLNHRGDVLLYGDASGGFKGHTVPFEGTDWTEIKKMMRAAFPPDANGQNRVKPRVPRGNPRERLRVNSLVARLETWDGTRRMLLDPDKALHTCDDLDSVTTIDGTMGDIDKDADDKLTHLSDALGYYVHQKFPLGTSQTTLGDL